MMVATESLSDWFFASDLNYLIVYFDYFRGINLKFII